jgi:hypothetical protein
MLLLAAGGQLSADPLDPVSLIGLNLTAATSVLGLPQSMFPFRGSVEARDDVVFYYPAHFYIFWYMDRVWQVRMDRRYTDPVFGLAIGMSRGQAESLCPRAVLTDGDSSYFDITSAHFPVRVRLVFAENLLSDVYVYRSDF